MTAMVWSYLGVATYISLQVCANIAYARMLGPDQFGLFASGLLATGILRVISDLGLGSALTQARSLEANEIRLIFTRLTIAGACACAILMTASGHLALLLKDPRLIPVFRFFALSLLLFPCSTLCTALLARNLDHKRSQLANVAGYAIGYCGIGLTASFQGMGAWSPIIGFFSQLIINTAVLFAFARPDLRPLFGNLGAAGGLASYGFKVMLTNVSNWLIYSMDNLLVQRLFGTARFGIYSVAYNVVRTPADHVVQTMQNVLLPASAQIKEDPVRLRRAYVAVLDAVLVVTLPMFATVAVLSTTFVEALYGSRWLGAGAVLAPLALAMPMQATSTVTSALLWGIGSVGKELRIQWLAAAILFATIIVCARISFGAVAWGVLFAYSLRSLLMVTAFARIVELPMRRVGVAVRGAMVVATIIAVLMWGLDFRLRQSHDTPLENLLLEVVSAAAIWIGLILSAQRWLFSPELRGFAATALGNMMPKISFWIARRAR
jgi:O-antigen/teichoic acid export membrane protein